MKKNIILTFVIIFTFHLTLNVENSSIQKPNILFVEVDDLPPHYSGAFGGNFSKTPNIDKLASDGFLFTNAICQGTMCGPSRNSLITGLYPHNLGFYRNGKKRKMKIDQWSLPGAMKRANYKTAWVGKCHVHPNTDGIKAENKAEKKTRGLQRMGFDFVFQSLGRAMVSCKNKEKGLDPYVDMLIDSGHYDKMKAEKGEPTSLPDDIYMDGYFTKIASNWLINHNKEKPFFLWLNYSCPHGPFDVKQSYHNLFKAEDIPEPNNVNDKGEGIPELLRPHPLRKRHNLKEMQMGFSANTAFIDDQVAKILNVLKENNLDKNTIIFFFSDHGMLVGDHGLIHKATLYKEVLNPSLIIFDPSKKKGQKITHHVELLDIVKTTLDYAMASEEDKKIPFGTSLTSLLNGGNYNGKKFAVGESTGYFAMVNKNYKCILPFDYNKDGKIILFNLINDPDEMKNIAEQNPKIVEKFVKVSEKWLSESGPVLPPLDGGKF